MLRIQDVHPGSKFFPSRIRIFPSRILVFSIPDSGSEFFHPGSRICIKEFTQWFQNSRKYDPGCSSRTRIPDPGVKKEPDPVYRIGSTTLARTVDISFSCGFFSVQAEVINYSGDLNTPPDEAAKVKRTNFIGKKKVKGRGARDDDSDDENDW